VLHAVNPQVPLDLGDSSADIASLHEAYFRVPDLAREGISFQRALATDSIRRCLVNLSEVRLRTRSRVSRS
jgi:hypothetical protein